MRHAGVALLALLGALAPVSCRIERSSSGRPGVTPPPTVADSVNSAEVYAALRLYYARLTSRDWKVWAQSFWPRATVTTIMRATADSAERVHIFPIEDVIANASRNGIRDC